MRYIENQTEQMRVAQVCHVDGHFGVTKTVTRIKERFMWKGILKDVKSMVILFFSYSFVPWRSKRVDGI